MTDGDAIFMRHHQREDASHAVAIRIALGQLEDLVIGYGDRLADALFRAGVLRCELLGNRLDGYFGGAFTGGVAAYPIHYEKHARGFVHIDAILVVWAVLPGVAGYAGPPRRRCVHGSRRPRQFPSSKPAVKIRNRRT